MTERFEWLGCEMEALFEQPEQSQLEQLSQKAGGCLVETDGRYGHGAQWAMYPNGSISIVEVRVCFVPTAEGGDRRGNMFRYATFSVDAQPPYELWWQADTSPAGVYYELRLADSTVSKVAAEELLSYFQDFPEPGQKVA